MSRIPDREYVAPVQRLRIRYAKRGRLRFASHRDFQRALERALRRAGVPMAYSAGFSPHPRISYANAAPTGSASEAEYLEIALARTCDPAELGERINAALPPGLDIVEVVEARTPDFAHRLEASRWRIELPGVDAEVARRAVDELASRDEVEVERLTKNGVRRFDVRGAVLACDVEASAIEGRPCAILTVVLLQATPAVRPDDVLASLRSVADLVPPVPARVTREMQGPLGPSDPEAGSARQIRPVGEVSLGDPLDADRETSNQT